MQCFCSYYGAAPTRENGKWNITQTIGNTKAIVRVSWLLEYGSGNLDKWIQSEASHNCKRLHVIWKNCTRSQVGKVFITTSFKNSGLKDFLSLKSKSPPNEMICKKVLCQRCDLKMRGEKVKQFWWDKWDYN